MKFFIVLGALCFIQLAFGDSSISSNNVEGRKLEQLKCALKNGSAVRRAIRMMRSEIQKCTTPGNLPPALDAKVEEYKAAIKVVENDIRSFITVPTADKKAALEIVKVSVDKARALAEEVIKMAAESDCIKNISNDFKVKLDAFKACFAPVRPVDPVVPPVVIA